MTNLREPKVGHRVTINGKMGVLVQCSKCKALYVQEDLDTVLRRKSKCGNCEESNDDKSKTM